jgi:nucleoside 2-deoxyribosyltransferase
MRTILEKEDVIIYFAGKTWHADKFRIMHEKGYNTNASWVYLPGKLTSREDFHPPIQTMTREQKEEIWHHCLYESSHCDIVVLYCEPEDGDMLSGAISEAGSAMAHGKQVYQIGSCSSVEPNKNSDKAFTYCSFWHVVPETDLEKGLEWIFNHYNNNYVGNWQKTRNNQRIEIPKPTSVMKCNDDRTKFWIEKEKPAPTMEDILGSIRRILSEDAEDEKFPPKPTKRFDCTNEDEEALMKEWAAMSDDNSEIEDTGQMAAEWEAMLGAGEPSHDKQREELQRKLAHARKIAPEFMEVTEKALSPNESELSALKERVAKLETIINNMINYTDIDGPIN